MTAPPTHDRPDSKSPHRTAIIIATGDEIVLGQRFDTNSAWLARHLTELGVLPVKFAGVGDDRERLSSVLIAAAHDADLVLITGGLGPTDDDMTRLALADAMGEALIEDKAAFGMIQAWYARAGRSVPESARSMSMRPPSARVLDNAVGSAPGLAARVGRADVFCLPGPPGEMRDGFERHVRPAIRRDPSRAIAMRVLPTIGLGESDVAQRLGPRMARDRNPLIGTTASSAVVTCRVRYEGPPDGATAALDNAEREVRAALGACVLGAGERTIAEFVVDLLHERSATLAVAESCTGGLLGGAITGVDGSSDVFIGGWITYANAMKQSQLGVPASVLERDGAVSRACAEAMSRGALQHSGATHAIAITGIAGPTGGMPDKPVGTVWISVTGHDGQIDTRRFAFVGDREAVRVWSVNSALAMVRLSLIGESMRLLRQVE